MPEIVEGRLAFRFPDDWHVAKFDDRGGFAERNVKIKGTKKVDILALAPAGPLLVIEIKDFRGHAIANRHRTVDGDDPLHVEAAQKVRDTISVLTAAYRDRDPELRLICQHLFGGIDRAVEVILFLEEDETRSRTMTGYRDRPSLQREFERLRRPYKFLCQVQRRRTMPPRSAWSVHSLPHPP